MMKAKLHHRVIAKLIDLMIVFLCGILLPPFIGAFLGFLYSLLADGISGKGFLSQSVGKKILHLRVVHLPDRQPAYFRESAIRNIPVAVVTFFAVIPVWGWLIVGLLGVPMFFIEVYLMWKVETGHRLGDVMAETEVVDVDREARMHRDPS